MSASNMSSKQLDKRVAANLRRYREGHPELATPQAVVEALNKKQDVREFLKGKPIQVEQYLEYEKGSVRIPGILLNAIARLLTVEQVKLFEEPPAAFIRPSPGVLPVVKAQR